MVNVVPGSHHQIAAAESQVAFGAFYSKESADVRQAERRSKRIIITRCEIMCRFPPLPVFLNLFNVERNADFFLDDRLRY